MKKRATVIGAGLAGCEAAWQLARRGIPVTLVEMKPHVFSPAHHSAGFAELVCSNSLRSDRLTNAVGLLKEEMRQLGSLILRVADATRVPAGGALAVVREAFSAGVTREMEAHPLIEIVREEAVFLPQENAVIATGPLTHGALAGQIAALPGLQTLHFYDAAAPIVSGESLNMDKVFRQSRYGRGDDYLNCPLNREEYEAFYHALLTAEKAEVHWVGGTQDFYGFKPIGVMVARGEMMEAADISRLLHTPAVGVIPEDDCVALYQQLGRVPSFALSEKAFCLLADNIANRTKKCAELRTYGRRRRRRWL